MIILYNAGFLIHFNVHERAEQRASESLEYESSEKKYIITKLSNASNIASKHIAASMERRRTEKCRYRRMVRRRQTNWVAVYADGCYFPFFLSVFLSYVMDHKNKINDVPSYSSASMEQPEAYSIKCNLEFIRFRSILHFIC